LRARLRRPHARLNPHGPDLDFYLLEQDIRAVGGVRNVAGANRLLPGDGDYAGITVDRARHAINRHIAAALGGAEYAGVITALVTGDQRGIGDRDWNVFSRVGISHLLAISGLHITMLAALAGWFAARGWHGLAPHWPRVAERIGVRVFAAWIGLAVAASYVLLAGFAVPAQRTLWMLAVVAAGWSMGLQPRPWRVLAVALVAVLAWDPWAVRAAGFWLSFVAVGVLMFVGMAEVEGAGFAPADTGRLRALWQRLRAPLATATRAQLAVTVALTPITLYFFQAAPVVGPLANAVAIPVISYVVTPLALVGGLAGTLLDWDAPLHLALAVFAWLGRVLAALAAPGWASAELPAPSAWATALATLGLGWVALPRGVPARAAGLLLCAPLLLAVHARPAPGQFRLTVVDVGQGTAVLVETAGHRLLYDTGPRYTADTDAGNRVLVPLLRAYGIGHLDGLVISHQDSDHAGGAASLLARRDADWLLSSLRPDDPLQAVVADARRCEAGQRWRWDGVDFAVLHPSAASYDLDRSTNARSCVLHIDNGAQSALLTGDIDAASEHEMLVRAEPVAADVLLVAHHGSRTSSSPEFLVAVGATTAVIQSGWLNRFGHPRADVVARIEAAGARVLRTDERGAITLETGAGGWFLEDERAARTGYWSGR